MKDINQKIEEYLHSSQPDRKVHAILAALVERLEALEKAAGVATAAVPKKASKKK